MVIKPSPSAAFSVVICLCLGQLLTMVGAFSFPALLPGFMVEWSLTSTQAGWVSGAIFGGYAVAVPILSPLTDRMDAKRIYLFGAVITALSLAGFWLGASGFLSALGWRFLSGVGLAGTYMPGLKALVDRIDATRHPRWISYYTASFSLGTSLSFLVSGLVAQIWGWQGVFALSALCAALAVVMVLFWLAPVSPQPQKESPHPFDFLPVLRNRAAMGYVLGYTAHVWELFAARSWMVAFLAFVLAQQPPSNNPAPTTIATIGAVIAMVASIAGADLATRFDRRLLCIFAMMASASVAGFLGFCSDWPYGWVALLMLLYNALIQLDSAALTTGMVLAADPKRRGATIAVHSFLGFTGGFAGPLAFGWVLDWGGGGQNPQAWGLAFASLAVVSVLGPVALLRAIPRPGIAGET